MPSYRRDDISPDDTADVLRRLRAEAAARAVLDREAAERDHRAAMVRRELAAQRGKVPGQPLTGTPAQSEEHLRRLDRIANSWRGEAECEREVAALAAARAERGAAPTSRVLAEAAFDAYQQSKADRSDDWKGKRA